MNDQLSQHRREPLFALSMSLICPGAGHVYCGQVVRGLLIFLGIIAFTPVIAAGALLTDSLSTFILLAATLMFVVLYMYGAIDALRWARRAGSDYRLQPCNRGVVYLAMLFVGVANPVVSTFLLRSSVFEAFYIPQASMAPALTCGDRIIVNKVFSRRLLPDRGQIVVFRNPEDRTMMYVKRVIGLPGDNVELEGNQIRLNGTELTQHPYPKEGARLPASLLTGDLYEEEVGGRRYKIMLQESSPTAQTDDQAVIVPSGHCFLLGDNRDCSKDSRHFSVVPLGDIEGRVQAIFLPSHSWRRFGSVD